MPLAIPLATAWPSPAPVGSVSLDSQLSIDSANPVPLPPDKQWGAREYIGARPPPLHSGVGDHVSGGRGAAAGDGTKRKAL